ncbi:MAG: GNAT family N-acetyltransferase, partial [Bacillota bacterium]|nr:GNAT family N-acetyltransferase [Bacillota bacterium]
MFNLRNMQIEDIKKVQHVAKTSWNSTYAGIIPLEIQDKFITSAYSDEMMKRRMERSLLFVSEVNGQIVGFANYSPVQDDGAVELLAIYLLQEFQGNGIGTALLMEGINSLEGVK